jgi:phage terminase large subunit
MIENSTETQISIPKKLLPFVKELKDQNSKFRYLVLYGGRGGGKSENIGRALIMLSMELKIRILCAREYQTSIRDSVHKILKDVIEKYNFTENFHITEATIKSINGSEFIFKGIANDPDQIKSLQGVDICWVEEAQRVSNRSLDCLIPTIRNKGSKIIFSFNPMFASDPVYDKFVTKKMDDTLAIKINYYDNPWIKDTALLSEIKRDKKYNPEKYNNIWLGDIIKRNDAIVFAGHYHIENFETPDPEYIFENRFFYGLDFGFSQDPTAFVRCFILNECLYVDYEAGGVGILPREIEKYILDKIPYAKNYIIYGDSARPELIADIKTFGYHIKSCQKGAGSIEAGITYLKNFKKIIIHRRCEKLIENINSYSYKIDRISNEILPQIIDKDNDYIDALRYALNDYIFANINSANYFEPFYV